MRRIGFAAILALLMLAPFAEAQQPGRLYRIGFLFFGAPGPSAEADAFRQGLRELGYKEGLKLGLLRVPRPSTIAPSTKNLRR